MLKVKVDKELLEEFKISAERVSTVNAVKGNFGIESIVKRDKNSVPFDYEKVFKRVQLCCQDITGVIVDRIVQQAVLGLPNQVSTVQLDRLLAETSAYLSVQHPNYALVAGRLSASALHKITNPCFSDVIESLFQYVHPRTKENASMIDKEVYAAVMKNKDILDKAIVHSRDYNFDYFGFTTLSKSYLLRLNGVIVERPQHLFMRVAVGIHKLDLENCLKTYEYLSQGYFIHATPTLFNSGTPKPQMSSCFLVCMSEDSIEGIYDTLKTCALISKYAGGIGLSIHNIRASKSYIRGTNGESNGLVPMLRVFNDTARYVDQGGGKRKGSFAVYLEPWHADIYDFLQLKKNTGKEENRARDLFYALWIPDLFMKRVEENGKWSLFCPNEAPGLADCWGEEFEKLYCSYEEKELARKQVSAQSLWFAIIESQIETGTPYMLFKDSANRKSNQQNLGTIKSSNLCTEIIEYTAPDEVAVCNLASIALPKFVDAQTGKFDHFKLREVVHHITGNLNKVIDLNFYPVPQAAKSNFSHRPIGIGVQGLADLFFKMRLPFDSKEAAQLNKEIFETIYFSSLEASMELAKKYGPYKSYPGSPISKGVFQFDMWNVKPTSHRWDWEGLRVQIQQHGVRNSLLISPMPTASTSQILGNNECFEPITSNIYVRRVLSGEFPVVNLNLVNDLEHLGLWDDNMMQKIIAHHGSVQKIEEIPEDIKALYKTVWELKLKTLIDMAADRGAYIDQSQSFNVFMAEPTTAKLTSLHFYTWKKGLKTGMYYLRTKPAAQAIQFTVDPKVLVQKQLQQQRNNAVDEEETAGKIPKKVWVCKKEEGCFMCSS